MSNLQQDSLSETLNINSKNLTEIVNLVEELVINKVRIEKIKNEISEIGQVKVLDQELRIISDIQNSIKKVGLIKIKTINDSLEKLVKQMGDDKNKSVEFQFVGLETEIENSLLSSIHRVFVCLITDIFENEFDENTTNAAYVIKCSANSDGRSLNTIIESNGKGFDYENTRQKFNKESIDLPILSNNETIDFLESINYVASTDDLIKLRDELVYSGGSIKFDSEINRFMRISISIPLSSSIMQGMLVKVGEQTYAIPTDFIESITSTKNVTRQASFDQELIMYQNQVMGLFNLTKSLNIESNEDPSSIVIVCANNKKLALLVDSIIDQTDMVIKPKHSVMKDNKEFRGTTILGDGSVTLVLDIPSIILNL